MRHCSETKKKNIYLITPSALDVSHANPEKFLIIEIIDIRYSVELIEKLRAYNARLFECK